MPSVLAGSRGFQQKMPTEDELIIKDISVRHLKTNVPWVNCVPHIQHDVITEILGTVWIHKIDMLEVTKYENFHFWPTWSNRDRICFSFETTPKWQPYMKQWSSDIGHQPVWTWHLREREHKRWAQQLPQLTAWREFSCHNTGKEKGGRDLQFPYVEKRECKMGGWSG